MKQIDKTLKFNWNVDNDGQTILTTIEIQISKSFSSLSNQFDYYSGKLFII
jgi:hypothetical protein